MHINKNYNSLLKKVLGEGAFYEDPNRKGVKRLEIPSYTFRHNFKDGFPIISTKKIPFKSVVTELLWFLKGDTNIKYLLDNGCNIWNKDAYSYYNKLFPNNGLSLESFIEYTKKEVNLKNQGNYKKGDLGKVYGHYWRNFNGVDQIAELIDDMINKPMSSELLVVARDPSDKNEQALPCCHYGFQIVMKPFTQSERIEIFNSTLLKKLYPENKYLSFYNVHKLIDTFDSELDNYGIPKYGFELHWKQRSCDLFLGKIWELLK